MMPKQASYMVFWAILIVSVLFQGCISGGSSGLSGALEGKSPASVAGLDQQTPAVTAAEMEPFLGNWQGSWEEDYSNKSVSTTSETRRALLSVKLVSEKPMVIWALGAGVGGGTWHDAHTHYPPSLGRYPAKFGKKEGVVYLEFTTRLGNNYRFLMNGERLDGVNTSAGFIVRCDLMKSSQQELFTDASLAHFEVGLN